MKKKTHSCIFQCREVGRVAHSTGADGKSFEINDQNKQRRETKNIER